MKHLFLFFLIMTGIFQNAQSQTDLGQDSVSFEQQRERVNELLETRRKRFGDFGQSLQQKTGVFGIFKRKKDMQRSIDILREIVLTDNEIFLETKRLLDLKTHESDHNERLASEYDHQISAYMHTVTKLQTENEKLRNQINELDTKQGSSYLLTYILVTVILVLCYLFYGYYRRNKHQNLTQE